MEGVKDDMCNKKVQKRIDHIIEITEFFLNGNGVINKKDNDSDYLRGIYTPEDILGNIQHSAKEALKELQNKNLK